MLILASAGERRACLLGLDTALHAATEGARSLVSSNLKVFIVERVFGGNYIRTTGYNMLIVWPGSACSMLLEKIGSW